MDKIIMGLKKYEKLIEESNKPLLKFKREFESLVTDKKKLEKSNAELLLKLHDRNDEIEVLQKAMLKTDIVDENIRRLEEIGKLNIELKKIKSKWYVKLFYREKKIEVNYEVVEEIPENDNLYNNFINRHNPAGLPDVHIHKNADDNKLGEIKNQNHPLLKPIEIKLNDSISKLLRKKHPKKLKIKKLQWESHEPGYMEGFIDGIEKPLFRILYVNGNFALFQELTNGKSLIESKTYYLTYGNLLQAQESAQAILRKYILRFLEG